MNPCCVYSFFCIVFEYSLVINAWGRLLPPYKITHNVNHDLVFDTNAHKNYKYKYSSTNTQLWLSPHHITHHLNQDRVTLMQTCDPIIAPNSHFFWAGIQYRVLRWLPWFIGLPCDAAWTKAKCCWWFINCGFPGSSVIMGLGEASVVLEGDSYDVGDCMDCMDCSLRRMDRWSWWMGGGGRIDSYAGADCRDPGMPTTHPGLPPSIQAYPNHWPCSTNHQPQVSSLRKSNSGEGAKNDVGGI